MQNVLIGVGNLSQTVFLIDFGVAKEFWNTAPGAHIPFQQPPGTRAESS